MFGLFKKPQKRVEYAIDHLEIPEEVRQIGRSFSPPATMVHVIYDEFWLYDQHGELLEVIWFED